MGEYRGLDKTAERILEDIQQSERVAISSAEGVRHVVRLSVAVYAAFHWLPNFLPWFRDTHPGIEIEIETQGAQSPFDALTKGRIDLVISPDSVLPGQLDAVDLFEDELVAVVPAGHALATRKYVNGNDFLKDPFLTYSLVRQPGYEADRIWTPENVLPPREENIGSVEAICELVKAGFGISILSHWAIHPQFQTGKMVPVRATQDGLGMTWRAITKAGTRSDAPEGILSRALANWFHNNPPCGIKV